MKDDFRKFMELVKTDENLQKKLEEAGKNYTGEQTEEAVFNSVVVPIAKEAGFSIDLDDARQSVQKLNMDEMEQVAGGGGYGAGACFLIGFGGGIALEDGTVACALIGGGLGLVSCGGEGVGIAPEAKSKIEVGI